MVRFFFLIRFHSSFTSLYIRNQNTRVPNICWLFSLSCCSNFHNLLHICWIFSRNCFTYSHSTTFFNLHFTQKHIKTQTHTHIQSTSRTHYLFCVRWSHCAHFDFICFSCFSSSRIAMLALLVPFVVAVEAFVLLFCAMWNARISSYICIYLFIFSFPFHILILRWICHSIIVCKAKMIIAFYADDHYL